MTNYHSLVNEYLPTLIGIRRRIHEHPELAFQEIATAALVVNTLQSLGLDPITGIAGTGVTALIKGNGDRTVAIRADMDALPIQEQSQLPYASTIPNVMHACGHDGHVAIALGAAMVLRELRPSLGGNVKLIFQPAEEGPGGASAMISQGVLRDPEVEAIFGFHLVNNLKLGAIGVTYGQTCAATDEIKIAILGKGGHDAYPHLAVDAITTSAQFINALQTISSRQTNPLESVVITIGTIRGGYANNVVADKVELCGAIRTLSEPLRTGIPEKIEKMLAGITAASGATYRFVYSQGSPSLYSDPAISAVVERAARTVVGDGNIVHMPPTMGGEDFAYFARARPASFFRIGSGNQTYIYPGHHPRFNFAEEAIAVGVQTLVQAVIEYFAPQT